jgi:hypothetical protein
MFMMKVTLLPSGLKDTVGVGSGLLAIISAVNFQYVNN